MDYFEVLFGEIEDPRAKNRQFDLVSIIFIALVAVLCGAQSCSDMADFAEDKEPLLKEVLKLPYCTPSHDTFCRVFRIIDPEKFEEIFARFSSRFSEKIQGVVAIDGKAVRGAYLKGRKSSPLHIVNVWAAEARLAIGQTISPNRNEIKGVINALSILSLDDCIVTADALHCRKDVANAILQTGADYALAIKENHPNMLKQVIETIDNYEEADTASNENKSHGRSEKRSAIVAPIEGLDFPNVKAVAKIVAQRDDGVKQSTMTRYFLLSKQIDAEKMIQVARTHWTIENQLHWVLDVVLNEDGARNKKDNAPRNLSTLRKIALNILRQSPDKASLRRKIKKAGWNDTFLFSLLAHMR